MKLVIRTLVCMALAAASALPAWGGEMAASLNDARNAFLDVLDHKGGSLSDAERGFTALLAREPANPLYLSYLGACSALRGDAAWMPWKKMQFTEQGLEMIDKALSILQNPAPGSRLDFRGILETRFVAARTFIMTPDRIFHRGEMGRRLMREIRSAPEYQLTAPVFRSRVENLAAYVKENE